MTPKFLILCLPRSRSAWLSHFLRYSGKVVTHDLAIECAGISDFEEKMKLCDGSVETGAVLGWRLIQQKLPGVRLMTIRRDFREVGMSLGKFNIPPPWEDLILRDVMLDQVEQETGALRLEYQDLESPAVCKMLFEHCLELPFDWKWWSYYHTLNVQVNMQARLDQLHANHARLEAFKAEVAEQSKSLLGRLQCLN